MQELDLEALPRSHILLCMSVLKPFIGPLERHTLPLTHTRVLKRWLRKLAQQIRQDDAVRMAYRCMHDQSLTILPYCVLYSAYTVRADLLHCSMTSYSWLVISEVRRL